MRRSSLNVVGNIDEFLRDDTGSDPMESSIVQWCGRVARLFIVKFSGFVSVWASCPGLVPARWFVSAGMAIKKCRQAQARRHFCVAPSRRLAGDQP
jgi:hypothetical protein